MNFESFENKDKTSQKEVVQQEKNNINHEKMKETIDKIFGYNYLMPDLIKHAAKMKDDGSAFLETKDGGYAESQNYSEIKYVLDIYSNLHNYLNDADEYDYDYLNTLLEKLRQLQEVIHTEKRKEVNFIVNEENIEDVVENPTPEKLEALREYLKRRKFGFSNLESVLLNSDMDTYDIVDFFHELYKNCKY